MGFSNVRKTVVACALVLAPVTLRAQQVTPTQAAPAEVTQATTAEPTLRSQLMPEKGMMSNVILLAANKETATHTTQPVMASRGGSTAYMLTGAALFVAGILISGDAGTGLMVAGAGLGGYGVYLNFR